MVHAQASYFLARANPAGSCSVLQLALGRSQTVCSAGQPRSEQGDKQHGLEVEPGVKKKSGTNGQEFHHEATTYPDFQTNTECHPFFLPL